jgi:hypothetical protein
VILISPPEYIILPYDVKADSRNTEEALSKKKVEIYVGIKRLKN